jgi:hypothetical protein
MATTSVREAFDPAFKEIARRTEATRDLQNPTYFESSNTLPFFFTDQRYTLLTLGTSVLAPRPLDATRPSLRIYGCFATREEAVEHAEAVQAVDDACSLLVAKTHEWVLFPQTEAVRDDKDESTRCLQLRLQAHRQRQAEEGAAFERDVRERVERPPPTVKEALGDDADEVEDAERTVYAPLRRMRAGAEVRGHAAVALCVIPDELRGECLVKILGCFESESVANDWVHGVATRHITEDDVLVARTCEWIFPNGTNHEASTLYRAPELQRIMDASAKRKGDVMRYKDWKKTSESAEETMDVE